VHHAPCHALTTSYHAFALFLAIHAMYASLSADLLNLYGLREGDDDLGEEGDGGEVDDADLEDDWGLDTE